MWAPGIAMGKWIVGSCGRLAGWRASPDVSPDLLRRAGVASACGGGQEGDVEEG